MVFPTRAARDRLLNARSFYLAEIHRAGDRISLYDVCDDDEFGTEDGRMADSCSLIRNAEVRLLES
jgi:hypothetical protein